MINGYPPAGVAKKSVKDWPKFGYTDITEAMPKVDITYHDVYSEKDSSKIKQHLTDKDASDESYKVLQAKTGAADKAVGKLSLKWTHPTRQKSV